MENMKSGFFLFVDTIKGRDGRLGSANIVPKEKKTKEDISYMC